MNEIQLTKLSLDRMFRYDPKTGHLTRKFGRQGSPQGCVIGTRNRDGNVAVVDGESCRVDRLVWIMHHGIDPLRLKHIDGDKYNDRIENLEYVPPPKPYVKKVKVETVPEGNQWWKIFEGVK